MGIDYSKIINRNPKVIIEQFKMRVAHNSKFKTQNSKLKKKPLLFSRTEAAETKKKYFTELWLRATSLTAKLQ
nr:MAG TPA: hypothetical protein [Caudoviricetes sp.]